MAKEGTIDLAFRLRRALCSISEKRPSYERAILDQFLRYISPSQARSYGSDFPHTTRRHPRNPERCVERGVSTLLYFHTGNAILGFYDYIAAEAAKPYVVAKEGSAYIVALERINRLEAVAKLGVGAFYPEGNDMEGHELLPLPPNTLEKCYAILNVQPPPERLADNGGSTGIRGAKGI